MKSARSENEIIDAARQFVFASHGHAIGHVSNDRRRGLSRVKILVCIDFSLRLILDEEHWVQGFAHIMKEGTHAREQGIRANLFGGLLSQVRNLQTVLIGAGRVPQKELQ